MPGHWKTISPLPAVASGAFSSDAMLLMTDGSVLLHNAYGKEWLRLTPDNHGHYETGTWSPEIDMTHTREYFASGVLKDGRVFAIGGEDSDAGSDTPLGEIFDPLTNTWSAIVKPAAFDFVRGDCNGTVLADGRVLLGGATPSGPPSSWSKRTAIWDPGPDTWTEAGLKFGALAATDKKDPFEEETFTMLRDGSVLVPSVRDMPGAQRYVPSLDDWIDCAPAPVNLAIDTLNGAEVFETGPVILLPDGKALAVGGTGNTAIFTPGNHPTDPGSWIAGPVFPNDTSATPNWPTLTALDTPGCLLPSGRVVFLGGTTEPDAGDYFSYNPVFLEYDPHNPAAVMPTLDVQPSSFPAGNWTWQSFFLLLPTGQLLCGAHSNSLFIYTPDPAAGAPHHSWKPAHIQIHDCMVPGHTYHLHGTQLNGMSQALSYGDDAGMATNYPIVRLHNQSTHEVVYARTHDFSTMGVATGHHVPHNLQSCKIQIPLGIAHGHWHLVVIANGIASEPVPVRIAHHC